MQMYTLQIFQENFWYRIYYNNVSWLFPVLYQNFPKTSLSVYQSTKPFTLIEFLCQVFHGKQRDDDVQSGSIISHHLCLRPRLEHGQNWVVHDSIASSSGLQTIHGWQPTSHIVPYISGHLHSQRHALPLCHYHYLHSHFPLQERSLGSQTYWQHHSYYTCCLHRVFPRGLRISFLDQHQQVRTYFWQAWISR